MEINYKTISNYLLKTLPDFDGVIEFNIEFYVQQFDEIANVGGLANNVKIMELKSKLAAEARKQLMADRELEKETDYEKFKTKLINKFSKRNTFDEIAKEFNNMKQNKNETTEEFVHRFEELADKYLNSTGHANNVETQNFFETIIKTTRFLQAVHENIASEIEFKNVKTYKEMRKIAMESDKAFRSTENENKNFIKNSKEIQADKEKLIRYLRETNGSLENSVKEEISVLQLQNNAETEIEKNQIVQSSGSRQDNKTRLLTEDTVDMNKTRDLKEKHEILKLRDNLSVVKVQKVSQNKNLKNEKLNCYDATRKTDALSTEKCTFDKQNVMYRGKSAAKTHNTDHKKRKETFPKISGLYTKADYRDKSTDKLYCGEKSKFRNKKILQNKFQRTEVYKHKKMSKHGEEKVLNNTKLQSKIRENAKKSLFKQKRPDISMRKNLKSKQSESNNRLDKISPIVSRIRNKKFSRKENFCANRKITKNANIPLRGMNRRNFKYRKRLK